MAFDQFDTRELFARLIQCEAGGEGENGKSARSYHPEIATGSPFLISKEPQCGTRTLLTLQR